MTLREVLKVSRPRFWLYGAATFGLIGTVAALNGLSFFSDWRYWVFALYFLIPANILIYGIGDIFDHVVENKKSLWRWILVTNIPFFFFVPLSLPLILSFIAFVFFTSFYSAEPIRAKTKPVIDSLFSAGHYVATGVFGYYLAVGEVFPTVGIIAGMCWAVAMHAYSTVPNVKADFEAGLQTIAIMIGAKQTIALCWFLYTLAAYLVKDIVPLASLIGAVVFSYFMWRSQKAETSEALSKLYTYFPLINILIVILVSLSLFAKNVL